MKFHKIETTVNTALWNDWASRILLAFVTILTRALFGEKFLVETYGTDSHDTKGNPIKVWDDAALARFAATIPAIAVGGVPRGYALTLEAKHDGETRLRECKLKNLSHLKNAFEIFTSVPVGPTWKRILFSGDDHILLSANLNMAETLAAIFMIAGNIVAPIDPTAKSPSDTAAWRMLTKRYGLPKNRKDVAKFVASVVKSTLIDEDGKRVAKENESEFYLGNIMIAAVKAHGQKPWNVNIARDASEKKPASKVNLTCGNTDHPSVGISRKSFETLTARGEAYRCCHPGCGAKLYLPTEVETTTNTITETLHAPATVVEDAMMEALTA